MRRAVAAGVAALALALAVAACGGDDGPEVPATASLAPPDSVFANATVRPEGDQAEVAASALSKLLNTDDPGAFITEQIDTALREGDLGITYSEDVEPWLGESVGIFFSTLDDQPDGALIAEVTDQTAAKDAVGKMLRAQGARAGDHEFDGVDYEVTDAGSAIGFVDEFLVLGSQPGFREAVEASRSDSLADDESFTGEYETVPDDALAALYADPPSVLDRLVDAGEITERQRDETDEQLGAAADQPVIASLDATEDSIGIQTAVGAGDGADPEETPLLRDLPADAWLAFGATDLGPQLGDLLDQLAGSLITGSDPVDDAASSLLGTGIEDFTKWMGDAAGFASGTSVLGIGTALEIETTDEAASEDAIDSLLQSLQATRSVRTAPLASGETGFSITPRGLPAQIVVVQREGRVIVGLGDRSVDDVLEPAETLADSEAFGAATEALGSDYAAGLVLQFEPMLELLEGTGATEGDPEYEAAQPYLDHLDYLVAGRAREDDRYLARVVLGLR